MPPFSLLADALLKSTALLGVLTLAAVVFRKAPASVRHTVWGAGLVGVLALPVASRLLPWKLEILPALKPAAAASVAEPASADRGKAGVADDIVSLLGPTAGAPAPAVSDGAMAAISGTGGSQGAPWDLARLVQLVWGLGGSILLAHLLFSVVAVRRIARRGEPLDDGAWQALCRRLERQLGITRPVPVLMSPDTAIPVTWGALHPTIVVPAEAADWSEERRRAVLLHELAHVRRRDLLMHLLGQLVCSVYWFHPLVWLAARRLRVESERACDDLVLDAGIRPSSYAADLLDIVRGVGRLRAPAVALPLAQRSEFEGRLLAILEPNVARSPRPWRSAALAGAVGLLVLPLAAMRPATPAATDGNETVQGQTATPAPGAVPRPRVEEIPARSPQPTPGRGQLGPLVEPELTPEPEPSPEPVEPPEPPHAEAGEWAHVARTPAPPQERTGSQDRGAAVMPLIDALRDASPDVRLAAAQALGDLGDARAVAALGSAVADDDLNVRKAAVRALGELQDPRGVSALSEALRTDADPEVRAMAAWALGQIEDVRGVPALGTALREDRAPAVRRQAAWALGQIEHADGVPALSAGLNDADLEVRRQVVWALGQIETPAAVEPLATVVRSDADARTRSQAAWALGQIEDARAVPALTAALRQDREDDVRKQAAWALGQIESGDAADALGAALRDSSLAVRRMAIWALGQIDDTRAAPALVNALSDADPQVRSAATHALGQIESAASVEPLAGVLARDAVAQVRANAAWALGQIEDRRAATALAAALKDQDASVRRQAAWGLGQLNLQTAPDELLAALADSDLQVRRQAAHAVGQIEDPRAVSALTGLVNDADVSLRRQAVWALSQIADQASIDVLVGLLKHEDAEVRRMAARALGQRR
jgi:HEAT repeat protein/beta-lactamase regulating signal transducer with metallopeptidase domain